MSRRKAELTRVAASLMRSKSFAAFTFQELADAVGIRKASVHHHFPTKERLALDLIDYYRANGRRMMEGLAARCEGRPGAMLDSFLGSAERVFLEGEGDVCPHGAFEVDAEDLPESIRTGLGELLEEHTAGFARLLDAARAAGEATFPGEPLDQARLLMASIQGARALDTGREPVIFRSVVRQLREGLGL